MKPHILMIDDDVDFLQILSHLIDAMGYTLSTTTSAEQGIELAEGGEIDLIFCDLRLRGGIMSGLDFAREIQGRTALCDIPVIAVTGFIDNEVSQEAIKAGFTDVFTKPIKFFQIKNAVEQYVGAGQ